MKPIIFGVILYTMILRNIENKSKQERLLEAIGMNQIKNDIKQIIYEEYDEELAKKDQELLKLDMKRLKIDIKLKRLHEMDDLNTDEARKIIDSLVNI